MFRLKSALSAVSMAAGVAVVVAIFVVSAGALPTPDTESPSEVQYDDEGVTSTGSEGEDPGPGYYHFYDRWTDEDASSAAASSELAPSEGSDPAAQAPESAREIMEPPTPYSQVVDNASSRQFYSAPDWTKTSKRVARYGPDYRFVKPDNDMTPAWFRVRIPTDGFYAVYARWPAAPGNNPSTSFQISTASGVRKVEVNQRRDGGVWERLGAYKMNAGNLYSVQVSGRSESEGRIIADAVMVVAGTQAAPQAGDESTLSSAGEPATYPPLVGGSGVLTGETPVESEVLERARSHLGTPYEHSPPLPCIAYESEDCSCFTSLVFSKWVEMPDNPVGQWYFGQSVEKSDLRPGDLVFFKEAGEDQPITHVGIYSGRGYMIHASTYWGMVVERPMKYVDGYFGARRLT